MLIVVDKPGFGCRIVWRTAVTVRSFVGTSELMGGWSVLVRECDSLFQTTRSKGL